MATTNGYLDPALFSNTRLNIAPRALPSNIPKVNATLTDLEYGLQQRAATQQNNNTDFFGQDGVDPFANNAQAPVQPIRATSGDGLTYLDTGELTPLGRLRRQSSSPLGQPLTPQQKDQLAREEAKLFRPTQQQIDSGEYKFDGQKGMWYIQGKKGFGGSADGRVYISNDPKRNDEVSQTPMYSVNNVDGRLVLSPGDPNQAPAGQRLGTQEEADRGNANYLRTGNSSNSGGGSQSGIDDTFVPGARPDRPDAVNPATPETDPTAPTADDAAAAPVVDDAKINALLAEVGNIQAQIGAFGESTEGLERAKQELARQLTLAKAHAIGNAKGAGPRGRSALVNQAIGEGAALDADLTQNAAVLNAQQEEQRRKLKLDVQKSAADLGLQEGAIDIQTEGLNMQSASNYLENLFTQHGLNMKIDEREAARVTDFVRDMALVQKDLDQMDQNDRNAFLDRLLREHGISVKTSIALKAVQAAEPDWLDVGLGIVKTAGPIIGLALASDERLKTDIRDATDSELDELLSAFKPKVYAYTDERLGEGSQFGGMAQDLQKTKLGAGMVVQSGPESARVVHGGKAGMAALAGLAMVNDKLKRLEEML